MKEKYLTKKFMDHLVVKKVYVEKSSSLNVFNFFKIKFYNLRRLLPSHTSSNTFLNLEFIVLTDFI